MIKSEVTYPKYFTGRTIHKLIGMKLIYTGSNEGPLSGTIISAENEGIDDHGRASIKLKVSIDWKTGTIEHTNLNFGQLKFTDKNTITGDSYSEITFYPNGYPKNDCSMCRSKCKATTPCDLYDSILKED